MQRNGAYLALVLILCFHILSWLAPQPVLGSVGTKSYQIAEKGGNGESGHGDDDNSGKGNDNDGGNSNSAKTFTIQDTPEFEGKNGFIGDDHVPQQDFTVYVFVTNGGQTQNVDAPQDVAVDLALVDASSGGEETDLGDIVIPQGSSSGSLTVRVPYAGSWYIKAEGELGKGSVTVESNTFLVKGCETGNGLVITPSQATVDLKGNPRQQFTATWTFTVLDWHYSWDVTDWVTWASSKPSVATIQTRWQTTPGLATGVATGQTTITAELEWPFDLSATANLTVTDNEVPEGLVVSPSPASVPAGEKQQFTADLVYPDNSTKDVTTEVVWGSDSLAATVGQSTGLATGIAPGLATISASYNAGGYSFTATAVLTVKDPVAVGLDVSPGTVSLPKGESQPFTAWQIFSNGTRKDVTAAAVWTSSDNSVATVGTQGSGDPGLAVAVNLGTVHITAAYTGFTAAGTLTVTAPVPLTLIVTPNPATVALGLTRPFLATLSYSDGNQQSVTDSVVWSSGNPSVATVGTEGDGTPGLATGVSQGGATIMATYTTGLGTKLIGSADLKVTQPVPVNMSIFPPSSTVEVGKTCPFSVTVTYSDGTYGDQTAAAAWSSSNPALATVDSSGSGSPGLATGIAPGGPVTITAAYDGLSAQAGLTVTPAPVPVALTVTPTAVTISVNGGQQFTATLILSDKTQGDVTDTAVWQSSDVAVVAVGTAGGSGTPGYATGIASGTAIVTVTDGGFSASAKVTVAGPAPPSQGGSLWEYELPPS